MKGGASLDAPLEPPVGLSARRTLGFFLALGLSLAPLVFAAQFEQQLGQASRLAMVWLPWIVLAGWPAAHGSAARDWPLLLAWALPVTALAAWYDRHLGLGLGRLEATFAAGLLVSVTLGEARARAARGCVQSYGALWLVLVGILPALAVALAWGAGTTIEEGASSSWLASFSPLTALWRDVQPVEGDLARQGVESAVFCGSTLACLALLIWTAAVERRRSK